MTRRAFATSVLALALALPASASAALYSAWDLFDDVAAANEAVTGRWLTTAEGAIVGSLGATRTFELRATSTLGAQASRSTFEAVARGRNSVGSTVARYAGTVSSPVPLTKKAHAWLTRYSATQAGATGNFLAGEQADEMSLTARPVLVGGLGDILALSDPLGVVPGSWLGDILALSQGDLSLLGKVEAAGGTASGTFRGSTLTLTLSVPENVRARELAALRGALVTLEADAKTYRLTSVSVAAADVTPKGERVESLLVSSRYLGAAASPTFVNPKKPLTLKAVTKAVREYVASF